MCKDAYNAFKISTVERPNICLALIKLSKEQNYDIFNGSSNRGVGSIGIYGCKNSGEFGSVIYMFSDLRFLVNESINA